MRDMSAEFLTAIAEDSVRVAEIYTITLASGTVYRFTSHSADITWDFEDNTYSSIPIKRGPISHSNNFEADACELSLAVISGDFYNVIQSNLLDGAAVVIKRILWDAVYAFNNEMTLLIGHLNIEYNRMQCVSDVRSIYDTLGAQVPAHNFETPCVHSVFDPNCGLVQSEFKTSGTATDGSRITLEDTSRSPLFKVPFTCIAGATPFIAGESLYTEP